ncbi:MAG: hypothetical protein JOY96_05685 [Verrucomicrobia bacterium]|nr:hypothetical protein [Verrucomicrobiota bacterium]MBV9672289.1 hypothetical protein [Verrucomicrobiota bacterium]
MSQKQRRRLCALLLLLSILGLRSVTGADSERAVKISPKALEVLNMPLLDIKEEDDPVAKLKKLKFNAALSEAKERYKLYQRGLTQLGELMEVGQRVLRAQVDLFDKSEDKIRVLQRQDDLYREAEANLEHQMKAGVGSPLDLDRLRYNMYSLELDLFRLKQSTQSQNH